MFSQFDAEIEMALKLSLTIVIIVWLFQSGSVFEVEYYSKLVALSDYSWWKWLLMGLLIAGSIWCPSLGLALMLGIFFYLSDTEVLTQ
jgi:hypothetical protein